MVTRDIPFLQWAVVYGDIYMVQAQCLVELMSRRLPLFSSKLTQSLSSTAKHKVSTNTRLFRDRLCAISVRLGKLRLVHLTCQLILSSYTKSTSVTSNQSANDIFLSQQIPPVPKKNKYHEYPTIFSLKTNQSPAAGQQYFSLRTNQHLSLRTNQHRQPATYQTNRSLFASFNWFLYWPILIWINSFFCKKWIKII
jgi:hypothetical protein